MSTMKFTLPLSFAVRHGHRHARKAAAAAAANDAGACAQDGAEQATVEDVDNLFRRVKQSLQRGFIGQIGVELSFQLDAAKADPEGDTMTSAATAPDQTPALVAMEVTAKDAVCPACAASNDHGAKFCNQCGTAMAPEATP